MPGNSSKHSSKPKGAAKVSLLTRVMETRVNNSSAAKRLRRQEKDGQEFTSSSEEDEGLERPHKDEYIPLCKKEFTAFAKMQKLPIVQDSRKMEVMYRYIDLVNTLMNPEGLEAIAGDVEEMEQELEQQREGQTRRQPGQEGPAFFRGNMATTIMLNGIDQLVRYHRQKDVRWNKAIGDLFIGEGVTVLDAWVVKKENNEVVSVLVKFPSRYQKVLAIRAVNDTRDRLEREHKAKIRVNCRDAFPKDQMPAVQACYNRGYQLKLAGTVQAYRIHNTGADQPTFEVRRMVEGKPMWVPAPPPTGDTPVSSRRPRKEGSSQAGGGQGARRPETKLVDEVIMETEGVSQSGSRTGTNGEEY